MKHNFSIEHTGSKHTYIFDVRLHTHATKYVSRGTLSQENTP